MNWTVPTLADCDHGFEPMEFKCVVIMAQKPEKTAGGIILAPEAQEREQFGSDHARLLAISPLAFTYENWPEGARKPQVGDVVFLGKYPGVEVIGRDGKTYRICNDREIAAVMERAEAQE